MCEAELRILRENRQIDFARNLTGTGYHFKKEERRCLGRNLGF